MGLRLEALRKGGWFKKFSISKNWGKDELFTYDILLLM